MNYLEQAKQAIGDEDSTVELTIALALIAIAERLDGAGVGDRLDELETEMDGKADGGGTMAQFSIVRRDIQEIKEQQAADADALRLAIEQQAARIDELTEQVRKHQEVLDR